MASACTMLLAGSAAFARAETRGISFDGTWEGSRPAAAWDGIHESYGGGSYAFVHDPDRRGTVARVTLPAGDQSAIEAIHHTVVRLGTTSVYGFAFKFPSGWRNPTDGWGCLIAQLGYPLLKNTNIGLDVGADYVGLLMHTGFIDWQGRPPTDNGQPMFDFYLPHQNRSGHVIPSSRFETGVWHLLMIQVAWATGKTGSVTAWHQRQGETAWTKTVALRGIPTMQWGTGITGASMDANGKDRQGDPKEISDKVGAYRDRSPYPLTVYNDGMLIGDDTALVARRLQGTPFSPAIMGRALPPARKGARYARPVTTRGGVLPFSWSVSAGTLPPGIRLERNTGKLSGRTKAVGRFRFTMTVKDGSGSKAARTYVLRVVP